MNAKQLFGGVILLGLAAACSDDGSTPDAGTGGTSTTGLAGAGGVVVGGASSGGAASGGKAGTGGKAGSGGKEGTGGKASSGGASGDGGSASGGKSGGGGTPGDGGSSGSGGTPGSGGNSGGKCASGKKLLGKVVINEIWALSNNQQAPYDFIELYNVSDSCVDLSGVYFHDIFPVAGTKATIGDRQLDAGEYLVLTKGTEFPFGLSNGGDGVALFADDGTLVDSTEWEHPDADVSWGRSPNGSGNFAALTEATPGAANASPATK